MVNIIGNAIIGHILVVPIVVPDVHVLWDDSEVLFWDDSTNMDWDG